MSTTQAVVSVLVVAMTVGIPLVGLTLRFSLKPLVEAYVRVRESSIGARYAEVEALRERVAALELRLSEGARRQSFTLPSELPETFQRKD